MSSKNSAKITFFYLLSLFGLVFTALTSGMILFQVINKLIPDVINYSSRFSAEQLRFAISAVIVASPVYYWMTSLIQKSLKKGELDKDSQLRKWMTYVIILVSAIVIIVSLIGVINNYLSGDLTSKIALKLLTTIIISGAVLSYYLYNIKRENFKKDIVVKIYFWSSLALVLAILISGFLVADSPAKVRNMKYDSEIIRDFNTISHEINNYHTRNDKLPKDLEMLENDAEFIKISNYIKNEETRKVYEYQVINDTEYELCATFRESNLDDNQDGDYMYEEWPHEKGNKCFQKKVHVVNELEPMIRPLEIR
jgi:TRAP-type C4-dicarboxylate transport system permease small subunit